MIHILLVDDHHLVRAGIKHILDSAPDMDVVAEASSGEDAVAKVRECKPDVVLMDVNMPGIGGLEATRKILRRHPGLKIIALTVHTAEPIPTQLLEAGARGYLTKGASAAEVFEAVRTVVAGDRYIASDIARKMMLSKLNGKQKSGSPFSRLSKREMQILMMITQGKSVQEISDALSLSPKTISTYRHRLYEKLNVHNDVGLTHLAMRHGLLGEYSEFSGQ